MWRFLIVSLTLLTVSQAQDGAAAFASPIYELSAFNAEMSQLNRYTVAAVRISGGTHETERLFVCFLNPRSEGKILFFKFQAREAGGEFLTPEFYDLATSRSAAISSDASLKMIGLVKKLGTLSEVKAGVRKDGRRLVTIGYLNTGGIEYTDQDLASYMPLFDTIAEMLQRGATADELEKQIETFASH